MSRAACIVVLLASCQDIAPLAPHPAPGSAEPASPPPAPLGPLHVVASEVPAKLAIDGRRDEWQHDAGAVFVALGPDKLVIAAPPPGEAGVSVALSSPVPVVPDIGWIVRGGFTQAITDESCGFQPVYNGMDFDNGAPQPPEVAAACRALVARHRDFLAAHEERFVRRFHLGATGVEAIGADGRRRAIAGASYKVGDGGAEAQLPLAEMPFLGAAPLKTLLGIVAEGESPAKIAVDYARAEGEEAPSPSPWTTLTLPQPVSFQPHAELRAAFLEQWDPANLFRRSPSFSFQPGDPDTIHVVNVVETGGFDVNAMALQRGAVLLEKRPLVTPYQTFGQVEVSAVNVLGNDIATFHDGTFVALTSVMGTLRGAEPSGDRLLIFSYQPTYDSDVFLPPRWYALAVRSDGTVEQDVADAGPDEMGMRDSWDKEPEPFSDEHFKKFGMRGIRKGKPKTVTWQWDEQRAKYVSTVTPANQRGTF